MQMCNYINPVQIVSWKVLEIVSWNKRVSLIPIIADWKPFHPRNNFFFVQQKCRNISTYVKQSEKVTKNTIVFFCVCKSGLGFNCYDVLVLESLHSRCDFNLDFFGFRPMYCSLASLNQFIFH